MLAISTGPTFFDSRQPETTLLSVSPLLAAVELLAASTDPLLTRPGRVGNGATRLSTADPEHHGFRMLPACGMGQSPLRFRSSRFLG